MVAIDMCECRPVGSPKAWRRPGQETLHYKGAEAAYEAPSVADTGWLSADRPWLFKGPTGVLHGDAMLQHVRLCALRNQRSALRATQIKWHFLEHCWNPPGPWWRQGPTIKIQMNVTWQARPRRTNAGTAAPWL